ncbi:MAG: AAA family ATPase [Promethearchaeota archaeon]
MIESIHMVNFRRHRNLKITLDLASNLIHGRNNSGKSTIFYAIEYCLFGSVSGFKRISQLATFKAAHVGVELVFTSRGGGRYRLQRVHNFKGKKRSAHGMFTLKEITSTLDESGNPEEKYLLASEFGDREEKLNLRISELIGMSKRYFETVVHFEQGSIAGILVGSMNFDIVFGITAANILESAFKEKALGLEKETGRIEQMNVLIDKLRDDRKAMDAAMAREGENLIKYEKDLSISKAQLFRISWATSAIEEVANAGHLLDQASRKLDKQSVKFETLENGLTKLQEKAGGVEKIRASISEKQARASTLDEARHAADVERHEYQENIRKLEQEKGDIDGMLKRRRSSAGSPTCEYCGAPIDPESLQGDILSLESALSGIDRKIREIEGGLGHAIKRGKELEQEKSTIEREIAQLQSNVKQLEAMEGEVNRARTALQAARDDEGTMSKNLVVVFDGFRKSIRDFTVDDIQSTMPDSLKVLLGKLEHEIPEIPEIAATASDERVSWIREITASLEKAILQWSAGLNATMTMKECQISESKANVEFIKAQIKQVDRELANYERKLKYLLKKQDLAEQYRTYQSIYRSVQQVIREKAATTLGTLVLEHHKKLSVDDEFDEIAVDNRDYSITFKPKNTPGDEMYPASVYQGGGHKLILGLAYKFAIGELISTPPFILIDEPTEFMDDANRIRLLSNLNAISSNSQVLLVTHHDVDKITSHKKVKIPK